MGIFKSCFPFIWTTPFYFFFFFPFFYDVRSHLVTVQLLGRAVRVLSDGEKLRTESEKVNKNLYDNKLHHW